MTLPHIGQKTGLVSTHESPIAVNKLSTRTSPTQEFEAVSYTWGPPEAVSHVRIVASASGMNEGPISIARNLNIALRQLRLTKQYRVLWIDALCINQQDKEDDGEKSRQVQMMGDIYSAARRVSIWLGPADKGSDKAFSLMRHWVQQIHVDWGSLALNPTKKSVDKRWADRSIKMPYVNSELEPVSYLLCRPYFRRTWIIQEIAYGNVRAIVQCGDQIMRWEDFHSALACLQWKTWDPRALRPEQRSGFGQALATAMDAGDMMPGAVHIAEVRVRLRHAECSDQLDRIYGILSLLDRKDRQLGIIPRYKIPVESLYTDVAQRLVSIQRDLSFLETAELSTKKLRTPSWVPDWSTKLKVSVLPSLRWSACGWISAQAAIMSDHTLRVAGVLGGQIEHVISTEVSEHVLDYDQILRILRSVKPHTRSPHANLTTDFCATLVANDFRDAWTPHRDGRPDVTSSRNFLEYVWSTATPWLQLSDAVKRDGRLYLEECNKMFVGRCFFSATKGRIGLAPAGTQVGDIVTVLLGCDYPVVLRRVNQAHPYKWLVVGVCYIHGLMYGEAIYQGKLPGHYIPVRYQAAPADRINGWDCAMLDTRSKAPKQNPANILTEMGIKVDRFQREVHLLDVSIQALRASGVKVEHFDIM